MKKKKKIRSWFNRNTLYFIFLAIIVFVLTFCYSMALISSKAETMGKTISKANGQVHTVEVVKCVFIEDKQIEPIKWLTFTAYAYDSDVACCGKTDGITRSGIKAVEGITIAADWSVLPVGTVVYIEGIGERIVQDTGGAIKGNKIDIFVSSHKIGVNFGKQTVRLRMIESGENK